MESPEFRIVRAADVPLFLTEETLTWLSPRFPEFSSQRQRDSRLYRDIRAAVMKAFRGLCRRDDRSPIFHTFWRDVATLTHADWACFCPPFSMLPVSQNGANAQTACVVALLATEVISKKYPNISSDEFGDAVMFAVSCALRRHGAGSAIRPNPYAGEYVSESLKNR